MRSIAVAAAILSLCAPAASGEPLAGKNHSPVWFGLLFPTADTARAVAEGETRFQAALDHSNIYFLDRNDKWNARFDLELAQATIGFRMGFQNGAEIGIEQPFFQMGSGFLDHAVETYHRTFGFPMYDGQAEAPKNRFLYEIKHDNVTWHAAAPDTVTAGDTTFWLKKEVYVSGDTVASLKLVGQAPTASTAEGMGNGAWEYGALAMANKTLWEKVNADVSAGYLAPGHIDRGERYALENFFYWNIALDYPLSRWSVVVQYTGATSPYGGETTLLMHRYWEAVTIGGRYRTESGRAVEVAFTEDLSYTAPDFTLHVGVGF